jgi:hypothetical protein
MKRKYAGSMIQKIVQVDSRVAILLVVVVVRVARLQNSIGNGGGGRSGLTVRGVGNCEKRPVPGEELLDGRLESFLLGEKFFQSRLPSSNKLALFLLKTRNTWFATDSRTQFRLQTLISPRILPCLMM